MLNARGSLILTFSKGVILAVSDKIPQNYLNIDKLRSPSAFGSAKVVKPWISTLSKCPVSRPVGGARWLSGRVSDSGARGPGFETYRRVVSLSKTLYSPKVLVNYPGSDGSVPT